jgi:hypothetical protein
MMELIVQREKRPFHSKESINSSKPIIAAGKARMKQAIPAAAAIGSTDLFSWLF